MIELQKIEPRWTRETCIVVASGPSLNHETAELCRGQRTIAVNGAYRLLPFADILYACDDEWWELFYSRQPDFKGEKWSSHNPRTDEKIKTAEKWGINLIRGRDNEGFSIDPRIIHYGGNSGFQAINLAILFGVVRILLVGFDMRTTSKRHFHEDYPPGMKNSAKYEHFIPAYNSAALSLPPGIEIINCTPGSALKCFPTMILEEALGFANANKG